MIGIVLVTHGRLANEFLAALEHVVGPQEQAAVVSIGPDDDMEQRRQDILDAVARVDDGSCQRRSKTRPSEQKWATLVLRSLSYMDCPSAGKGRGARGRGLWAHGGKRMPLRRFLRVSVFFGSA